jgi:hypothetical protein
MFVGSALGHMPQFQVPPAPQVHDVVPYVHVGPPPKPPPPVHIAPFMGAVAGHVLHIQTLPPRPVVQVQVAVPPSAGYVQV